MRKHYRHKSPRKRCRAPEMTRVYRKTGALNSNMTWLTSDFKLSSNTVETACTVKCRQIDEKQRPTAKLFTSYRKSMSLNPFPMTDSRPEVELCTYCACADIIVMLETHGIGQTPSVRVRLNVILFRNYFRGLLQLVNIFQRVQCRWNNFLNDFRNSFSGWGDFVFSFRRGRAWNKTLK